jgi:hypothetical protein
MGLDEQFSGWVILLQRRKQAVRKGDAGRPQTQPDFVIRVWHIRWFRSALRPHCRRGAVGFAIGALMITDNGYLHGNDR